MTRRTKYENEYPTVTDTVGAERVRHLTEEEFRERLKRGAARFPGTTPEEIREHFKRGEFHVMTDEEMRASVGPSPKPQKTVKSNVDIHLGPIAMTPHKIDDAIADASKRLGDAFDEFFFDAATGVATAMSKPAPRRMRAAEHTIETITESFKREAMQLAFTSDQHGRIVYVVRFGDDTSDQRGPFATVARAIEDAVRLFGPMRERAAEARLRPTKHEAESLRQTFERRTAPLSFLDDFDEEP